MMMFFLPQYVGENMLTINRDIMSTVILWDVAMFHCNSMFTVTFIRDV